MPVIGVAKAGWNLDQLKARARDSLEKHGGIDPPAFEKLCGLAALRRRRLQRPGDVSSHPQRTRLRPTAGALSRDSARLFGPVVEQLAKADCTRRARHHRKAVRPRPRIGLELNGFCSAPSTRSRSSASTITSESARAQHGVLPFRQFVLEPIWNRNHVESMQITWRKISASGPGRFLRRNRHDPRRGPEPPISGAGQSGDGAAVRTDSESIRDEKVKVLKAIPPLDTKNVVRGQFRGYRKEKGVAPDSKMETFAALQAGDRFLALARGSVLHPGGKMPAGDLHGNRRPAPAASDDVFGI